MCDLPQVSDLGRGADMSFPSKVGVWLLLSYRQSFWVSRHRNVAWLTSLFCMNRSAAGFKLLADLVAALLVERVEAHEKQHAGGHDNGEKDKEGAHFEECVLRLRCLEFHVEAGDI